VTAVPLHPEHKRRRGRNYALAGVLILLVILTFANTYYIIKGNVESSRIEKSNG